MVDSREYLDKYKLCLEHRFKNRTGPVGHGSDLVRSFRPESVQTGIRSIKLVVRSANQINGIVPLESFGSIFFFHCRRPPTARPPPAIEKSPLVVPRRWKSPPSSPSPPTRPRSSQKATLPLPALEEEMRIQSSGRVR